MLAMKSAVWEKWLRFIISANVQRTKENEEDDVQCVLAQQVCWLLSEVEHNLEEYVWSSFPRNEPRRSFLVRDRVSSFPFLPVAF